MNEGRGVMFKHVLVASARVGAAAVIGFAGLSLVGRDSAKVDAPDAIFEAAIEGGPPNPPAARGGFIIPTMSFDTRAAAYPKLTTIEPGLPIKDYFDDFFPLKCLGTEGPETPASLLGKPASLAFEACLAQVVTVCRSRSYIDADRIVTKAGPLIPANQGILMRLQNNASGFNCGITTTAHGWETIIAGKEPTEVASPLCQTVQQTATRSIAELGKTGGERVDSSSSVREILSGSSFRYAERLDVARVSLIGEAMKSGSYGQTGTLSTDLEYEALSRRQCAKLDSGVTIDVASTDRFPTFEDIRSLTSVSSLRATCDLGVIICSSPATGQAADQKRCRHYTPDELGTEGDVYDFRGMSNGKGIVRHYGTSFKGLSGAGHYCLREGYEPTPFGMSVAVRPSPANTDQATYNNWLGLYIMQGSRERGEYVVVQHLANLADFEDFRKHQEMD